MPHRLRINKTYDRRRINETSPSRTSRVDLGTRRDVPGLFGKSPGTSRAHAYESRATRT